MIYCWITLSKAWLVRRQQMRCSCWKRTQVPDRISTRLTPWYCAATVLLIAQPVGPLPALHRQLSLLTTTIKSTLRVLPAPSRNPSRPKRRPRPSNGSVDPLVALCCVTTAVSQATTSDAVTSHYSRRSHCQTGV